MTVFYFNIFENVIWKPNFQHHYCCWLYINF